MEVTKNIKRAAVKSFAETGIASGSIIRSDGYRSYAPALSVYDHKPAVYNPGGGLLRWIHIAISNAKAFMLSTCPWLAEQVFGRLSMSASVLADSKG